MSQTDKKDNLNPSIKDPSTHPTNPNPKPGMKDNDQKTATDKPPVKTDDSKNTADKSSAGMSGDSKR
jgi:hypothetical protein